MAVGDDAVVTSTRVHQLLIEAAACASEIVAADHVVVLLVHRCLLGIVWWMLAVGLVLHAHGRLRSDSVL